MALRIVFMGTPEFAVGALDSLAACPQAEVCLVLTRPDAVSGRGKALLPSPVKARALELGIPVLETKSVRGAEVQEVLLAQNADLFCIAAFGALLPPEVLAMPRLGCINVHASLLPRGRGAAPMQRALLEGEEVLGVSIMRVEEGMDTGAYCVQRSLEVGDSTYAEVSARLSAIGGAALAEVVGAWAEGVEPAWVEQDESLATYAAKLDKAEMLLHPQDTARQNWCRVRASSDAAPARCRIGGRAVRVEKASLVPAVPADVPADGGSTPAGPSAGVADPSGGRLLLGCADGVVEVLRVRPDGKRTMDAREFCAGLQGRAASWEAL